MKDETKVWLRYAVENLDSAKVLLKSSLYNPCLQNVQQSVEKSLKALLIEYGSLLKKTHDILDLKNQLKILKIEVELSDDHCDFLNSIYLPSKYPLGSVIPDFNPDHDVCAEGISIAEKAIRSVDDYLK